MCSASTGLCQPRGTTPLGGSCTTHAECESNYCLILASGSGLCVRTCSASHQCPIDFVCRNIAPPQTTFCIHESLVGKDFGPDPSGTFCSDTVNRCHSGWCWIPQTSCTDTCQHDRDCQVAGRICQLFVGDFDGNGIDEMVTVCAPPSNGSGATGSACTANSQCLRGNCLSAGYCGDPCCRASDCPSGYTCEPVSGAGGSVIKACARTPGVGSAPVGTPCDPANDLFCRSNYCWEDGPGDPYCTDTCCSDSDCPEGFRCQSWPFDLDGDQVPDLSWPLCLRR
ncbi:MAG: hypothetical protein D6729_13080 [Deltaproteobacteria bacterium]|nr:MAG: hypothetical protein D6729_13080 [Deltaproteobacteria bacterium]